MNYRRTLCSTFIATSVYFVILFKQLVSNIFLTNLRLLLLWNFSLAKFFHIPTQFLDESLEFYIKIKCVVRRKDVVRIKVVKIGISWGFL